MIEGSWRSERWSLALRYFEKVPRIGLGGSWRSERWFLALRQENRWVVSGAPAEVRLFLALRLGKFFSKCSELADFLIWADLSGFLANFAKNFQFGPRPEIKGPKSRQALLAVCVDEI